MSSITRKQFDNILEPLNSKTKEYDYEYSLTTLVFGNKDVLEIKDVVRHMNVYAPEHPLFVQIVDALLNIPHIEAKYKSL